MPEQPTDDSFKRLPQKMAIEFTLGHCLVLVLSFSVLVLVLDGSFSLSGRFEKE